MIENTPPLTTTLSLRGRGSKKRIIYPSTYVKAKKGVKYKTLMKKIKNIFYLYLYRKEKEVILLHLFERNKFILLVEKRNGVKMIKKGSSTSRKKFP